MKTRHHKIPRSQGGGKGKNVVLIDDDRHKLWHRAWDNKTPTNIVQSISALQELFGDIKLSELKLIIETDWS